MKKIEMLLQSNEKLDDRVIQLLLVLINFIICCLSPT
jgi:hypothetical protein